MCAQRFLEGLRSIKIREQLQVVQCQSSKPEKFDKLIDIARRLNDTDISRSTVSTQESVMRVRCSYCRKPGHTEGVCRKKKREENFKSDKHSDSQQRNGQSKNKKPNWVQSAKCYNCSARGHLSAHCPQKKINSVSSGNSCPTKRVTLGTLTTDAIVDSGAAVSCISLSLLKEAFPNGYELSKTIAQLSGPGSSPLSSLGIFSTMLHMDSESLPCQFHVLDAVDDTFLLGWNFLSQFKKVVLKPQDNEVELLEHFVQENGTSSILRAIKTTVIPPRSQKVLRVSITTPWETNEGLRAVLLERNDDFESRTGLLVGRCVTPHEDTKVLILNPGPDSKTVYRCQTVGSAYPLTLQKGRHSDKESDYSPSIVNQVHANTTKWNIGEIDDVTKSELITLLDRYDDTVFNGLGKLKNEQCALSLKKDADLSKVRGRRRHYNPEIEKKVEEQVQDMLSQGVIEHSKTDVISPVVLVKKPDHSIRFCLDFRSLNKELSDVIFPLMTTNEALMRVQRSKYFTVLDMRSAFNQVELSPDCRHLTGFQTSSGVYQFRRLCFGLKVAPLAFQRMIHLVLSGLTSSHIMIYLDDCCVHTSTTTEHINCLSDVLQRFEEAGLTLKREKCYFFMESVNYLGFKISDKGVQPGDKGLEAIREYPVPRSWEEVRSFLGLCAYFMRFIPNYSDIALPLSKIVGSKSYSWTVSTQSAFTKLRSLLASPPVLKHPDFDSESPSFIVQTDANNTGLAGVLLEADRNGQEHPICYASKMLNKTERNYSTIHREALALIWSVRKFREYTYGRKFILRTDHRPLTFINTSKSPKCARWSLELADYQYELEYVKGQDNTVSDALSRAPIFDNEIDLPVLAITRSKSAVIAREDMIRKAHEIGHFAAARTLELARLVDETITLKEVTALISKCTNCLEGPHIVPKSKFGITETAHRPWELVHCDFVGPLPRTKAGYECLFTYKDDLTKFVLAWPLRSATTVSAISVLDRLISIFGPPQKLHSDNGSVFTSQEFINHCGKRNIDCRYTPVARPQANPVDRAHRTLKESLIKTANHEKDWTKFFQTLWLPIMQ